MIKLTGTGTPITALRRTTRNAARPPVAKGLGGENMRGPRSYASRKRPKCCKPMINTSAEAGTSIFFHNQNHGPGRFLQPDTVNLTWRRGVTPSQTTKGSAEGTFSGGLFSFRPAGRVAAGRFTILPVSSSHRCAIFISRSLFVSPRCYNLFPTVCR